MKLKIGDEVIIEFGGGERQEARVEKILTRYTSDMGEPYPVIVLESGKEFDGDTGYSLDFSDNQIRYK